MRKEKSVFPDNRHSNPCSLTEHCSHKIQTTPKKYDDVLQDNIQSGYAELLTTKEAKIQTPTKWHVVNFRVNNGNKV